MNSFNASGTSVSPAFRGMSFRTQLILGVCGLVFLTGSVVLWLAHRASRASTDALTGTVFREVSEEAAALTSGYVRRAAPVVESLAQLADHGLAVDDPDRLAPQLLAVLRANPGLSWISYGDETGTFTGAYRPTEGGLRLNRSRIVAGKTKLVEHDVLPDGTFKLFNTEEDSGYDPRVRPFYTKAKKEGRLVWLPPYVFYQQGVPGISCAAPVKDARRNVRGVLSVDFDLNSLSDFVSGLSASEHSQVFLFTPDMVLLAYPGGGRGTGRPVFRGSNKLATFEDAQDPLANAYRAALPSEHLQDGNSERFRRFDVRHEGTDYYASATRFRIDDDLVWVVGVVAPKSDFTGDVWRTQTLALIAAMLAVIAAVALAFALASTVSRPVRELIDFMSRVGGGDLEAKADFGGSGEFRQLADALNQMIADLRDRLRLRHSLGVAMEVQQRLLPAAPPAVHGLEVAGHSTYCDETGGDYYDFLVLDQTSPDAVLIALGDVMGHGIAAALVMAGVRAVLRDRFVAGGELAGLMSRLNRLLSADHQGERFMTMHLSVVDAKTRTMRWVSAGHDPALVYDPATDQFEEIGEGDLPLGVMDETEYREQTSPPLKPGQVLVVGTDGVWEMPDVKGEQFGKDRLRDVIRESAAESAATISKAIQERLAAFQGNAKKVDDVTFVIVKVLPESNP